MPYPDYDYEMEALWRLGRGSTRKFRVQYTESHSLPFTTTLATTGGHDRITGTGTTSFWDDQDERLVGLGKTGVVVFDSREADGMRD
ncbi:unnamed protein product [Arctogadus glacialis]